MFLRFAALLIILLSGTQLGAQENDSLKNALNLTDTLPEKEYEPVFKPTFGLGVGCFTFLGDVGNNHKGYNPLVSRIGFELKVNHPLTPSLDLGFYVIFGKISANERDGLRNLNFESRIRTGGGILTYNFSHLLPPKHSVEPYIFTGFESFEFLSKTDLYDKYGNQYHYWSDGSIRNLDENSPNAASAIILHRDYQYESDLREQNLDGFGKYRERSWAVPVGAGVQFLIGEKVRLKIGTSMHFTFTDMVDNVSAQSVGNRQGDSKNDKFLYSSFSLNYDLSVKTKKEKEINRIPEDDDDGNYYVRDLTDLDNDGVRDFDDHCLNTPPGVAVDAHGCPLDKDKDYVPDYLDDELPTPKGNFVNERGVSLTDADFELQYLRYIDTTGQYHGGGEVEREEVLTSLTPRKPGSKDEFTPRTNLTYFVVLGSEKKQITANELYKYLGQKDFRQIESGDTVFYVIGNYENIAQAISKQEQLEKDGIKTNGIGQTNKQEGNSKTLSSSEIDQIAKTENNQTNANNQNNHNPDHGTGKGEVLYRVQIGAFDKKLSQKVFKDVPDVLSVTGPDDKVRYYSGSFTSLDKAADRKLDLVSKGFESAFIVAYRDGERISLKEAGAQMVPGNEEGTNQENNTIKVDPGRVRFKVQIGAFRNDIPAKVLDVFLQLGNVQMKRNDTGLTIYLVGSEDHYESAEALKKKVVEMGIGDAFVVGEFNGSIIPAQEAIMLKSGK